METLHETNEIIADRYRIVNPLGRGQSSSTYEAEDLTNNQRVALKVLSLRQVTDWKVLELFEREAKILSNLNHPAIPKYINYFHSDRSDDRRFYLVQELVSGESLFKLVQKGWHPSEKEVQGIALQVLEILDYLHEMKPPVIHRDIKPQNLMRTSKGKIYLVDFGAVQDVYRNTLTRGGTFVGTLGYMPLEQFSGSVVPGSDLYSLGATLLFLLTGRDPEDLPHRRMKIDFRSRVQIKPQFADWLEKMLAPAHEDRFQSATEAKEALGVRGHRRAEKGTVALKYPQPDNSDIFIHKTDQRLVVKLFNYNLDHVLLDLQLFITFSIKIFLISFMTLVVYMIGTEDPLFPLLFIVLFSFIFAIVIYRRILELSGTITNQIGVCIEINIGRNTFNACRKIAGIVYHQHQGETADMGKIETEIKLYKLMNLQDLQESLMVEESGKGGRISARKVKEKTVDREEREITKLLIWEGVRKHSFRTKSREECEWLVAEISEFLAYMRSGDAVDR